MALKIEKAELHDAYKELDEVVGVEPAISKKLSVQKFGLEMYKTVFGDNGTIDDDEDNGVVVPDDKFSDETMAVFEALKAEFWKGDDKKGKKGKGKKEEPKAEKGKKGKGKKKEAEKDLAAELKDAKTLVDLKAILDDNDEFDEHRELLSGVKNVMVLRKQMSNALAGEEVVVKTSKKKEEPKEEPKAEKKGKKDKKGKKGKKAKKEEPEEEAEPLVSEQIEGTTNEKELKAILKANEDLFEGFKAKKKWNGAKLQKEMLKHVEPVKSEEPKKKKKGQSRSAFGHLLSATSGKIDAAFQDGDKVDVEELAEELGVTKGRVLNHLSVLKKNKGVTIKEKKGKYWVD